MSQSRDTWNTSVLSFTVTHAQSQAPSYSCLPLQSSSLPAGSSHHVSHCAFTSGSFTTSHLILHTSSSCWLVKNLQKRSFKPKKSLPCWEWWERPVLCLLRSRLQTRGVRLLLSLFTLNPISLAEVLTSRSGCQKFSKWSLWANLGVFFYTAKFPGSGRRYSH